MSTLSFASAPSPFDQPRPRLLTWCLIGLLHVGFFAALNSGLMQQVQVIVPKIMFTELLFSQQSPTPALPPTLRPTLPRLKEINPPISPTQLPPPIVDALPATSVSNSTIAAREVLASAPASTTTPTTAPMPLKDAQSEPKIITGVEYLQAPRPEYPATAKRRGEEGVVQLRVLINELGRATQVVVVKSSESPRLDEAARLAVLRALFKPHMENGRPMAVFTIVPINFRLS